MFYTKPFSRTKRPSEVAKDQFKNKNQTLKQDSLVHESKIPLKENPYKCKTKFDKA
jgi:hypothetical protein